MTSIIDAPRRRASARILAYSDRALGSALRLQVRLPEPVPDRGVTAAAAAWREIRAEFDRVDVALSRFRSDSELTALNRAAGTGSVVHVSWRLRETIAVMHRAGRVTDGRFDGSVAEALELLGEPGVSGAERDGTVRSDADPLDRPRPVLAPATPLDTGGIGKGLALRWAARRALPVLPEGAGLLLDAGGDIVAAGTAPADGWLVGIEDPAAAARDDAAEPVAVVRLHEGAVATSSVRVRRWLGPGGQPVHHVIDPRTGAPARTGILAVTVAAPDPAWAEVWTKALFLAGRSAIATEARSRDIAAWWITDDGRVGLTPAARERSAWVAERRVG